jgi:hypothetical protein
MDAIKTLMTLCLVLDLAASWSDFDWLSNYFLAFSKYFTNYHRFIGICDIIVADMTFFR